LGSIQLFDHNINKHAHWQTATNESHLMTQILKQFHSIDNVNPMTPTVATWVQL